MSNSNAEDVQQVAAMKKSASAYTVYIDESFFRFWGLRNPTDNFCYLAFGVPNQHVAAFDRAYGTILENFRAAAQAELKISVPAEMKSTLFRQLCFRTRRGLALHARNLMLSFGCFVLAEYSEVQGFILESVRSDLLEKGSRELPEDWAALYDAKRKEFLLDVEARKLGQSPMLESLIALPSAGLAHYLGLRAESYEILIDPRKSEEDKSIGDALEDFTRAVGNLIRRDAKTNLKSINFGVSSDQSPGLQIADLLAGEARWWFVTHPEFLAFKSGRTLLKASELTTFHAAKTDTGRLLKPERRIKMPNGLLHKLSRADSNSVFPFFRALLANGLLSCLARYGEFRHIDLANSEIIDSPDDR